MGTSKRIDGTPATGRRAPRRPACSSDGLKVTIKVIRLPDPESNPLRARQLAVIVNLLRRAAAEVAERDVTPYDDA
jgi:hypothetical protein